MAIGNDLESMMARFQDAQRRAAAQEAQQKKAAEKSPQAGGQAGQPGADGAQGAQGAQPAAAGQTGCTPAQPAQPAQQKPDAPKVDLDAAAAQNDAAGEKWGNFQSAEKAAEKTPVLPTANTANTANAAADGTAKAPADGSAKAPAADTAKAAPTGMAKTLADNPKVKTNQDLINHYYKEGGGSWGGASKLANADGTSLNKLIRDRAGKPEAAAAAPSTKTPPATTPATPAPVTAAAKTEPGATGPLKDTPAAAATAAAAKPETQGVGRSIRPFRETDQKKLEAALPQNAKHLAKSFIDEGRKNNIDPVALAAISKHETGNFTSSAFKNKNNAMGISDSKGPTHQASHEASIARMAKVLNSPTGPYKGKDTIGQIANTYAPIGAGNDPGGLNNHWGKGVAKFADDFASKTRAATSTTPTATPPAPATTSGQPASTATSGATTGPTAPRNTPAAGAPANGTATTDVVSKAGQRNQMTTGRVTINGNTYTYNSGGSGNGNLPKGQYAVTAFKNETNQAGMVRDGVGFSFALSDKHDPRTGRDRTLLRIHPDGGNAGTLGCMGIVGNAATLRQFRNDMNAELRRNGGRFNLTVN